LQYAILVQSYSQLQEPYLSKFFLGFSFENAEMGVPFHIFLKDDPSDHLPQILQPDDFFFAASMLTYLKHLTAAFVVFPSL